MKSTSNRQFLSKCHNINRTTPLHCMKSDAALIMTVRVIWFIFYISYKIWLAEECLELERKLQKSQARLSVFNERVLLWYFGGLLIAVRRGRNVKWCEGWGQMNLLWLIMLTFLNTRWSSTCDPHLQKCSTRSVKQMWVLEPNSIHCWALASLHGFMACQSLERSVYASSPKLITNVLSVIAQLFLPAISEIKWRANGNFCLNFLHLGYFS